MADALAALRAEMAKKRSELRGDSSSSKQAPLWRRKADVEAERIAEYHAQEAAEEAARTARREAKLKARDELLRPSSISNSITKKDTSAEHSAPPLNVAEVVRRLRAVGEPATLFGEGPRERYARLREVELAREEGSGGQRNVFQTKLREIQAQDADAEVLRYVGADVPQLKRMEKPGILEGNAEGKRGASEKEDYVHGRIRDYMALWQKEIEAAPVESRRTSKGRVAAVTYEQTKEWLKPLIKLLRKRKLKKNILDALKNIFVAVEEKEYVEANNIYLEELAIGNAPWPMGATMVGIHARAAREKIGEDKIAHVMNDEQTRKYIQAVKRLVTVAQRHYPTVPSKMIS